MQLISVMQDVFNRPAVPFNPAQQTLKGWAMYCLRDRGFLVESASNADFAVATKGEKVKFKVSESSEDLDLSTGWIVVDPSGQKATVIAPQA